MDLPRQIIMVYYKMTGTMNGLQNAWTFTNGVPGQGVPEQVSPRPSNRLGNPSPSF